MDPHSMEQWLALNHLPGMSARLFHGLLEVFASPGAVLDADPDRLAGAGVPARIVAALREYRRAGRAGETGRRVSQALQWSAGAGRHILFHGQPGYPARLEEMPDPPAVLYVRGSLEVLHGPLLAMVGSRTPSAGGRRLARRLARALAGRGLGIVSGMALGIDKASHQGALAAGGRTLAVLGTGVDRSYPAGNSRLAEDIAARGALVSEFPLGTPPRARHFPLRNRIISALSHGVLVVEAAEKSGSLITAECALEQGREVMAVPGAVDNSRARGCHALLRQGAKLVECADDVLEELPVELPPTALSSGDAAEPPAPLDRRALTEPEARVLDEMGFDTISLDQLVAATGLETGALSAALTQLEVQGWISRGAGGYSLVREPDRR